jgi:hypothetical protein
MIIKLGSSMDIAVSLASGGVLGAVAILIGQHLRRRYPQACACGYLANYHDPLTGSCQGLEDGDYLRRYDTQGRYLGHSYDTVPCGCRRYTAALEEVPPDLEG